MTVNTNSTGNGGRLALDGALCDWCRKPAVAKWREGRGTGHSESVYACDEHRSNEHR